MLKKISSSGFLGLRPSNQQRFVAVSLETGDVIWMKKPLLWANHFGEADVSAFETQLSKLPKSKYKRERLIGVVAKAPQVSIGADRSFILALENTQLVLVAEDLATKQAWVSAGFSILEQRAGAISLLADAAMTAAVADAAAKADAFKSKAAADLKTQMDRGHAQLDKQIARWRAHGQLDDEERTCVICYDACRGYNEGVQCDSSEPHFVCNECFVASVHSSISDDFGKQGLRGGRLACPLRTFPYSKGCCTAPCYDDRVVAKKVDAATFEAYLQVRTKLAEAKFAREADAEMERQIAAAITRMETEGPQVIQTEKYICDEILTLRCSRCKMAKSIKDCLKEMCATVEQRQKVVSNLKQQFDDLGLQITVK